MVHEHLAVPEVFLNREAAHADAADFADATLPEGRLDDTQHALDDRRHKRVVHKASTNSLGTVLGH